MSLNRPNSPESRPESRTEPHRPGETDRPEVYRAETHSRTGEPHRSIGELVGELSRETTDLVRKEVALAKAELGVKIDQAERGVINGVAGGAVAYLGLAVLLFAVVYALSNVVAPWLAAVIVGGVVIVAGLIMLGKARSDLKAGNLKPEHTIRQTRETGRWIKEHV